MRFHNTILCNEETCTEFQHQVQNGKRCVKIARKWWDKCYNYTLFYHNLILENTKTLAAAICETKISVCWEIMCFVRWFKNNGLPYHHSMNYEWTNPKLQVFAPIVCTLDIEINADLILYSMWSQIEFFPDKRKFYTGIWWILRG